MQKAKSLTKSLRSGTQTPEKPQTPMKKSRPGTETPEKPQTLAKRLRSKLSPRAMPLNVSTGSPGNDSEPE